MGHFSITMNATTKKALQARLTQLTASVEALPEDIFSDEQARNQVQGQISGLKAAIDTPLETVFDILLQVCLLRVLKGPCCEAML